MNKQIIADIAEDAAELVRQLPVKGIRDTGTQAAIVAGAMPGFVTYETEAIRRAEPVDRLGRGDISYRDDPLTPGDPRIPGRAEPGER